MEGRGSKGDDGTPPKFPITETVRKLAQASGAYSRWQTGGANPLFVGQPLYDALAAAGTDMKDIAVHPPLA